MSTTRIFLTAVLFSLLASFRGYAQGNCTVLICDESGALKLAATLVIFNDEDNQILKKVNIEGSFDLSTCGDKLQQCAKYTIKCDNKDYWPIQGRGAFPCGREKLVARKKPNISQVNNQYIVITKPHNPQ